MEAASFGEWVRRRRLTLDLTQAQLAGRVACATITIRKIESDERRPSKLMADRLAEALELEGDGRARFAEVARAVTGPARLPDPLRGPPGSVLGFTGGQLPSPAHPLIGREHEVTEVLDRLDVSGGPARLLTVTGAPGVGKTRLALEVASRAERKLDVPVVFVDLTTAGTAADLAACLAGAFAIPAASSADPLTLTTHVLRRHPALVVFDNFEHLLEAAGTLGTLVESCPGTVCLVTSRTPLDVYAEHVYPLATLPTASAGTGLSPAVELFLARAAARAANLDLGSELSTVTSVCELLDGLPLAIELAARRVPELAPQELLESLRSGGDLGTLPRGSRERQRSAHSAVEWSVELLSPSARDLLVPVAATFRGSFDTPALVAMSGLDDPAREVAELTTHGLLRAVGSAGTGRYPSGAAGSEQRYDTYMLVREYARHVLSPGDLHAARRRHAVLTAGRAEAISPGIDAWPERETIDALGSLEPDVRAGLEWSFGEGGDPATGRRLVGAAAPLWYFRGQDADMLRWATAGYCSLDPTEGGAARCRSAYYLAAALWSSGDGDRGLAHIDEAVSAARTGDDPTWLAEAVGMRQMILLSGLRLEEAMAMSQESLATGTRAGGEWELLAHLRSGRLSLMLEDHAAAAEHTAACASALERAPSTWGRCMVLSLRGDLSLATGDAEAALNDQLDAIEGFLAVDAVPLAISRASAVASSLLAAGRSQDAAAVYGALDAWREDTGVPLHPMVAFAHARDRAAACAELGPRFEELAGRGASVALTAAALRDLLGS